MERLLNKYGNMIAGWDSDESGYFIYLKKPWANESNKPYFTDLISVDTIKEAEQQIKRAVRLKPEDWDKMYNEDWKGMSSNPYESK